ncbi:MAG: bifunctional oligoribonuclease/PAP phosphatase NrnA [Bacteroidales bacterium]|nr:bifunctional oligoribonuclease/PAP phosphatase NrnA [Bacteroidales bacterium]
MNLSELHFSQLDQLLGERGQKILILSHRNPDGDAVGASLGLQLILKKLGHTVNILIPNALPKFLKWMPEADTITVYNHDTNKAEDLLKRGNLVFALDFNDLSRIREFDEILKTGESYKVLIDHHPNPGQFADVTVSDTTVSSTSELLYSFLHRMGLGELIDKDVATCLYAGIMTDTGCFSFNSSRPETFHIVADLLKAGIEKDRIFDLVYDNFSQDRMRLMGYCLNEKMVYLPRFRTAYIALSQEELRNFNFRVGDSEGFVNLPLSIADIRFAVLIMENKDCVKLSFRSKGSFPVNALAADHFNGGGHLNAAGGESNKTLQETIDSFVDLLPNYKDALLTD